MASIQPWDRTRAFRQTHLTSSAQNELTIPDLYVPRKKNRESFIFRLPDELLLAILEAATFCVERSVEGHCACDTWYRYSDMKILALVCHRFSRNVLPLLYHTINFHRATVPPAKGPIRLYRSLQKNPSLWQYCRVLSIQVERLPFQKFPEDEFFVANGLVSRLTRVRCLAIHGGFEDECNGYTWALIQKAVQHMREVEHFLINGGPGGLILAPIMMHVDFSSLKTLDIHSISEATDDAEMLELKKYRNASFTSLSISNSTDNPQATAQLLKWPTALSHFHFGSFYNYPFYMDLPLFHSMLWVHKDTLKTLSIGRVSGSGNRHLFNLSDFPNVEVLELSRWQMDVNLGSSVADANLLIGPSLKTFRWDFTVYDQHSESWDDFGDKEERWVRDFALVALAKKAALREIVIRFTPADRGQRVEDGYPWDRMDRVCDEIRPCGMLLKYNTPLLTKEAWLAGLSEGRDEWTDSPNGEWSSPVPTSPGMSGLEPESSESSDLEGLELDVLGVQSSKSSFMRGGIRGYFLPAGDINAD